MAQPRRRRGPRDGPRGPRPRRDVRRRRIQLRRRQVMAGRQELARCRPATSFRLRHACRRDSVPARDHRSSLDPSPRLPSSLRQIPSNRKPRKSPHPPSTIFFEN